MLRVRNYTFYRCDLSLIDIMDFIQECASSLTEEISEIDESSEEEMHTLYQWKDGTFRFLPSATAMGVLLKESNTERYFWRWLYPITEDDIILFDMSFIDDEELDVEYQRSTLLEFESDYVNIIQSKTERFVSKIQSVGNPVRLAYHTAGFIGSVATHGIKNGRKVNKRILNVDYDPYEIYIFKYLVQLFMGYELNGYFAPECFHESIRVMVKSISAIINRFCYKTCRASMFRGDDLVKCSVYSFFLKQLSKELMLFKVFNSALEYNAYIPKGDSLLKLIEPINFKEVKIDLPEDCDDSVTYAVIAPRF